MSFNSHLSNHACKSDKSFCVILTSEFCTICLNNFASSEHKNNLDPFEQHSAKLLMKIINNNRPKIEPCRIPLRTCRQKKITINMNSMSSIN